VRQSNSSSGGGGGGGELSGGAIAGIAVGCLAAAALLAGELGWLLLQRRRTLRINGAPALANDKVASEFRASTSLTLSAGSGGRLLTGSLDPGDTPAVDIAPAAGEPGVVGALPAQTRTLGGTALGNPLAAPLRPLADVAGKAATPLASSFAAAIQIPRPAVSPFAAAAWAAPPAATSPFAAAAAVPAVGGTALGPGHATDSMDAGKNQQEQQQQEHQPQRPQQSPVVLELVSPARSSFELSSSDSGAMQQPPAPLLMPDLRQWLVPSAAVEYVCGSDGRPTVLGKGARCVDAAARSWAAQYGVLVLPHAGPLHAEHASMFCLIFFAWLMDCTLAAAAAWCWLV
jgi:hypothetical protein